ncbi:hypothetical protein [Candidatus Nitrotoga arctica]|nr:hypothetical protein [Candidatus Nitrotoga arctica]
MSSLFQVETGLALRTRNQSVIHFRMAGRKSSDGRQTFLFIVSIAVAS